jgi:hypothetical protein
LSQITDKNWNRLKKSRNFCRRDQAGVAFSEQELAPFCGAIPLWIVLRLLTMFTLQFLWVESLLEAEQK